MLAFAEAGPTVNINDLNETGAGDTEVRQTSVHRTWRSAATARALAGNKLLFTSSPGAIDRTGPVVITIGTPVDEFLNPVLRRKYKIASTVYCRIFPTTNC